MENGIRIFRERAGLRKAELARRAGISRQQLGKLEAGHRKLSVEWAAVLAKVLNCTAQELMFPEAARLDLSRYSAIYDLVENGEDTTEPLLSIGQNMLARMLPASKNHRFQIMFVDTDDIATLAKRGDAIIVDLDDTTPIRSGVYAISIGSVPQWRRLISNTSGTIRITTDADGDEGETAKPGELEIIGRAKLKISLM